MGTSFDDYVNSYVAIYEAALGQSIPVNPRSYLYVKAKQEAVLAYSIDQKTNKATTENLATTASIGGLTEIGREVLQRDRFLASKAVIFCTFSVTIGVVIPPETSFTSEETGLTYFSDVPVTGIGDDTPISMTCEVPGELGNADVGSIVSIQSPVPGVSPDGIVESITTKGIEAEGVEEYRTKILDKQASQGGGSNLADYRDWGQEVPGVSRCFPYGGEFDDDGNNIGGPATRTVFVRETQTAENPFGFADQTTLDMVLSYILTDPNTLINRVCAGVPNSLLYTKSIYAVSFIVYVNGTDEGWDSSIIPAIDDALENYFETFQPAIEGLDPIEGRTNEITEIGLSTVVQGVTIQYGVNASSINFNVVGGDQVEKYTLPAGGLPQLNSVVYA